VTEIERAIANAVARVVVRRRLMRRVLQELDSTPNWDRGLLTSAPLVTPASGTSPHRAADAASEVAPCNWGRDLLVIASFILRPMEAAAGNTAGAFLPLGSVGWPTAENAGIGSGSETPLQKDSPHE
jgi:hypothetical protein